MTNFLGIRFPFANSKDGFYFDLTKTTKESVKSNLLHLLTTRKGNRLYKPDFGSNLYQYIFQPMDDITFNQIQNEITSAVKLNIQGINIDSVEMSSEDHTINLMINYSYNDGLFLVKDILDVKFS